MHRARAFVSGGRAAGPAETSASLHVIRKGPSLEGIMDHGSWMAMSGRSRWNWSSFSPSFAPTHGVLLACSSSGPRAGPGTACADVRGVYVPGAHLVRRGTRNCIRPCQPCLLGLYYISAYSLSFHILTVA